MAISRTGYPISGMLESMGESPQKQNRKMKISPDEALYSLYQEGTLPGGTILSYFFLRIRIVLKGWTPEKGETDVFS